MTASITCKAGSVVATFSVAGDQERARWAALTATEAFAFRMGTAAEATIVRPGDLVDEITDVVRDALSKFEAAAIEYGKATRTPAGLDAAYILELARRGLREAIAKAIDATPQTVGDASLARSNGGDK